MYNNNNLYFVSYRMSGLIVKQFQSVPMNVDLRWTVHMNILRTLLNRKKQMEFQLIELL